MSKGTARDEKDDIREGGEGEYKSNTNAGSCSGADGKKGVDGMVRHVKGKEEGEYANDEHLDDEVTIVEVRFGN